MLDFVSDTLDSGRKFRVFNVEDQFTRRGLGSEVDTSPPGARIVRVLDQRIAMRPGRKNGSAGAKQKNRIAEEKKDRFNL